MSDDAAPAPVVRLADDFFAAPQLTAADFAVAKALGAAIVINSRVEGEAPDMPPSAEMQAAAEAAGLAYAHIPVGPAGIDHAALDAFDAAVEAADGAVVGFCKSGFRSVTLRAFARARAGVAPDAVIAEAADAGFDLSPYRGVLTALGDPA
ncbi:MAG: TIGR01244 family sulfur transferase [Pseudomonadota bacterium]